MKMMFVESNKLPITDFQSYKVYINIYSLLIILLLYEIYLLEHNNIL